MRVLHLIPNMLSGGAQQQLCYLAAEQHRIGCEVHVAYRQAGPKTALLESSGATIHRLRALGNYDPFLVARICALVQGLKPDVVQTWLLQVDILGGLASRLTACRWILSERASASHYSGNAKAWLRVAVARGADAIVSNSAEGDRYWASRARVGVIRRVVRNGLPLETIREAVPVSDERIGLRPGEKMILYVGRLSPEKNLESLIPALGMATERAPAVAFLCGDGTHEAQTRALVARLGLSERVRLIGYVGDVWDWMKRADVFVSVSHYEGHPNAVLEAAACGVPLVLSEIPEHREILDDSAALFVDRFDPASITQALERSLREPDAARQRADAARRVVQALSIPEMAQGYDEVYREVLARRDRTAG